MKNVVGIFENQQDADVAITVLKEGGLNRNHIGLMAHEKFIEKIDRQAEIEQGKVQAKTELGAAGGAVVGGLTGLLVGVGTIVIPGVGPVLAAGMLGTILATTGMGAAMGGLLGTLTSLGITEEEASSYSDRVRRGRILVAVKTDDSQIDRISEAMKKAGAVEVCSHKDPAVLTKE